MLLNTLCLLSPLTKVAWIWFAVLQVSSIASAKESNEEVQASRNKINEDRNPQIDAAVVRVMKTRRVMEHNLLIAEVTKQLQSRFVPEPLVIKKRVEGLIDRDFLQRQKGNMKVYEVCEKYYINALSNKLLACSAGYLTLTKSRALFDSMWHKHPEDCFSVDK